MTTVLPETTSISSIDADLKVIDCDTHLTEAHDLWTSRVPAHLRERVPHVVKIDGQDQWVVDGEAIGFAGGGGVIDKNDEKFPFLESMLELGIDDIHPAAFTPSERVKLMDKAGIHAQVTFPNSIGLGGQSLRGTDPEFDLMCIQVYNDALAEIQQESNTRIMPMPVMPAWDPKLCAKEAVRVKGLGLKGVNMTSDPQDQGAPDLANRAWDVLWEVCEGEELPVHFHIGASLTAMNFYGNYFWASQDEHIKPAIGGGMLFINSARVLFNVNVSGMLDRYPALKMVAVESGIGWVPFMLEAMDYEMIENAPAQAKAMDLKPSEYFKRNWHATFWFEESDGDLQHLVDKVGDTNILFETDFPHPTCLYPDPLGTVEATLSTLRPESRRRIMGENAAKLYKL
jgi:uncharacterized protein